MTPIEATDTQGTTNTSGATGTTGITCRIGDATDPVGSGPRIIAHVCNDTGGWGRGFSGAVSRRWTAPERAYRRWYRTRAESGFTLGAVQFVPVGPGLSVANMIGQRGIRRGTRGPAPVRYEALDTALASVAAEAVGRGASVHMPRIGCGLAGGEWAVIEELIVRRLRAEGISVTVYDPEG
jgi:O-acetyl-ADP-ribose deacetylase (regulator of RNase III)